MAAAEPLVTVRVTGVPRRFSTSQLKHHFETFGPVSKINSLPDLHGPQLRTMGTPTKRPVNGRPVTKCLVTKRPFTRRPVTKRPDYRTS
jgi:hypothetical protein